MKIYTLKIYTWSGVGSYTRMGVWMWGGVMMRVLGWITPDGKFAWDPATLKPLEGKYSEEEALATEERTA